MDYARRGSAPINPLAVPCVISVFDWSLLFPFCDSVCFAQLVCSQAIKLFMMPIKSSLLSFADLEPLGKQALERGRERERGRKTASLSFAFLLFAFYCSQPFLMLRFPFKPFVVCLSCLAMFCLFGFFFCVFCFSFLLIRSAIFRRLRSRSLTCCARYVSCGTL